MELVRMMMVWTKGPDGRMAPRWVRDPAFQPPVNLASRRTDARALERAARYVRLAPTAG